MCALVSRVILQLRTLGFSLLLVLGCAKGTEIGDGEVVYLPILPDVPDASPEAGSAPPDVMTELPVPNEDDSGTPGMVGTPNTPSVAGPADAGVRDAALDSGP
jgi:hypothetical protein